MKNPFFKQVLLSDINTLLGALLLGSVALGASLVIVQSAYGQNPLTNVFASTIAAETDTP